MSRSKHREHARLEARGLRYRIFVSGRAHPIGSVLAFDVQDALSRARARWPDEAQAYGLTARRK